MYAPTQEMDKKSRPQNKSSRYLFHNLHRFFQLPEVQPAEISQNKQDKSFPDKRDIRLDIPLRPRSQADTFYNHAAECIPDRKTVFDTGTLRGALSTAQDGSKKSSKQSSGQPLIKKSTSGIFFLIQSKLRSITHRPPAMMGMSYCVFKSFTNLSAHLRL